MDILALLFFVYSVASLRSFVFSVKLNTSYFVTVLQSIKGGDV